MSSLRIINPGVLTSIQDGGRQGYAYHAIPSSGFMDRTSAHLANLILGKEENAPLIECTLIGPTLEFLDEAEIVVTGADMNWKLNGEQIKLNTLIKVRNSDVLKSGPATNGFRAYVGIKGALKVKTNMDSASTYRYAGLGHPVLKKNDLIEWTAENSPLTEITLSRVLEITSEIKIYEGPEFHFLTDESKKRLVNSQFTISKDTNRMGARLESNKLTSVNVLKQSVPVLPGFIQLPPDGNPIVILNDGQTTGGYPRIAYLRPEELDKFNQLRIGQGLRFNL